MEQAIRQFEAGQRHETQERMHRVAKEYRVKREDAEAAYHEFSDDVIDCERTASIDGLVSGGPRSMNVYLEETAEEMEALEPDSDKARVLIKTPSANLTSPPDAEIQGVSDRQRAVVTSSQV